jgi:hypothetical protein
MTSRWRKAASRNDGGSRRAWDLVLTCTGELYEIVT